MKCLSRRAIIWLCVAVSYGAIAASVSRAGEPEGLAVKLTALAEAAGVAPESLAFAFAEPNSGAVFGHRLNEPQKPASVQKILTCAGALSHLGPDFVLTTELFGEGEIHAGVLDGDLVVVGRGSPNSPEGEQDPFGIFQRWSANLKSRGITAVRGRIRADDSYLAGAARHEDWPVEQHSEWYCAPSGSLNVNDNCLLVRIVAKAERIDVELEPSVSPFRVVKKLVAVKDPKQHVFSVERSRLSPEIVVSGRFLAGGGTREHWIAIDAPTEFFVAALRWVLAKHGIEVRDEALEPKLASARVLFDRHSIALAPVLARVLKDSQNLYADCLLRIVGRERGGDGSFASGADALESLLATTALKSVGTAGLSVRDGSGLSHSNRVTPAQLVAVLDFAQREPWAKELRAALAVGGVDGTLRKRFANSALSGVVVAKTGHLNGVTTLAGYLDTSRGAVSFAFLYTGPSAKLRAAESWQQRALEELLSHYGPKPAAPPSERQL
ncbi:MAG: D-alanyl-D-alanine carboxypeptidase/D-alanyl-D-alanine-endopeptidase [Planctomycetota bacterium]